jgi:hypothetical protein
LSLQHRSCGMNLARTHQWVDSMLRSFADRVLS